jgi:antitoxin component of RelBE/YafQ-DinJ toxin-antitoxin module
MTYTQFAIHYGLTPDQAIALPALFERAAKEADMPIRELLFAAMFNRELGEYLAEMAKQVIDIYYGELENEIN